MHLKKNLIMKKYKVSAVACLCALSYGQTFAGEAMEPSIGEAMEPSLGEAIGSAEDPFADRLLGDWGGARTRLADFGLSIDLDGWYHLQGVADGGGHTGTDVGNLFSGQLGINFNTGKAGLWQGGHLSLRVDGRAGDSVLEKARTTSPVNTTALFPLVPGRSGEDAWAISELKYVQLLSEKFALMGGLLSTDHADANAIAGYIGSRSHFMNTAMLASPVVVSTAPTVTLGGGAIWHPTENVEGSFLVIGSNETAGTNPFENYEGTTFATEWKFEHHLGERPGGIVIGGTYGINQERLRINEDPRILFHDVLMGDSATTDEDSWSVYWNGHQYIQGDESGGWGVFGRLGFSDGSVINPIDWHAAGGIGGVGLLPNRENDRWGLGVYYQKFADGGRIDLAGIDSEVGGELFYNLQVTPSANLTFDLQVIDSALPHVEDAVVVGLSLGVRF